MKVFFALVNVFTFFSSPKLVGAEDLVVSAKNDHQDVIIQDLMKNFEALSAKFEALSAENRLLSAKVAKLESAMSPDIMEKGEGTTASMRGTVNTSRFLGEDQRKLNATEGALADPTLSQLLDIVAANATDESASASSLTLLKALLMALLGIDDIIEDLEELEEDVEKINKCVKFSSPSSVNTCYFGEHNEYPTIASIEMKTNKASMVIDTSGKLTSKLLGGYDIQHVNGYPSVISIISQIFG